MENFVDTKMYNIQIQQKLSDLLSETTAWIEIA